MSKSVFFAFRGIFRTAVSALVVGGLFAISVFFISTTHAAPGINQQFNFQGRLLTSQGAAVPDGYYNVQFKIYQDGDGLTAGNTTGSPAGSLRWTENWLNSAGKGVMVKNGYMSVELGSITSLSSVDWNQSVLWLVLILVTPTPPVLLSQTVVVTVK